MLWCCVVWCGVVWCCLGDVGGVGVDARVGVLAVGVSAGCGVTMTYCTPPCSVMLRDMIYRYRFFCYVLLNVIMFYCT